MDFAHLAYAVFLLTLGGVCAFLCRVEGRRAWLSLGVSSFFMAALELCRFLSFSMPERENLLSSLGVVCASLSLFALWDFARLLWRKSLPRFVGRWTCLLPAPLLLACLYFGGQFRFDQALWLFLYPVCWLLAADALARAGSAAEAFAAVMAAVSAFACSFAGIAGASQPLLLWGFFPALPLAMASTFFFSWVLWALYLASSETTPRGQASHRFGIEYLLASLLVVLGLAFSVAIDAGRSGMDSYDEDLKEDALYMGMSIAGVIERGGVEASGTMEILKKRLASLRDSHISAEGLRLVSYSNRSGLARVACSHADDASCSLTPSVKDFLLKGVTRSVRYGNIPVIIGRQPPAGVDAIFALAPVAQDEIGEAAYFLALQMGRRAYEAKRFAFRAPFLFFALLFCVLCFAFFAIFRMNYESKAALLRSEHEKELALLGAGAGTWLFDLVAQEIHCSPKTMEQLGYSDAKLRWPLKDWNALVHPDDLGPAIRSFDEHVSGMAEIFETQYRMRTADGRWRWILARGRVTSWDASGKPLEAAGTHMDVSAIRAIEAEVLRGRARLETAQRTAKLGLWAIDLASGAFEWDSTFSLILGFPPETKPSRELLMSIVLPEDRAFLAEARSSCVAEGKAVSGVVRVVRPSDSSIVHISGEAHLLRDEDGKPVRIEGVMRDITDFVEAKNALQRSERELRGILESLDDVVMRFSSDLRVLYSSPSLARFVRFPVSDVVGRTLDDPLIDRRSAEFWRACLLSVANCGVPMEREFTYDTAIGQRLFNWRLIPELSPDGKVSSVLSVARDITSKREAESAFRDIFNNMFEGFAMCDAENGGYRLVSINPAFERLLSLDALNALNKNAEDVIPGFDSAWRERFDEILTGGAPEKFEAMTGSREKIFLVSAYRASKSKIAFMLSDITENRKAEELLRNQMLLMKAIYDGIPDMLLLLRPDRSIVSANKAAKLSMGWADEPSPSSKCYHLLGFQSPCVDCACSFASDRGVPCMRNSESIETGRCYEIRALPIMSVDGKTPELVVELIRDTTEKKSIERDIDKLIDSLQAEILQRMNVEEALRRSEKLHRMLTDAAQVGIWQLTPDGHIKYLNPRMRELLSLPPDAPFEDRTCFEFIPESRIKPFDIAKDGADSFIHTYESELSAADGARREVLVSGIVLYAQGSKRLETYIETFTDITQIRKAEREAEQRKLKMLQTEKMASLGILVSGIAHEINNPTNFIMLNAPILNDVWKGSTEILDAHASAEPSFLLAGLPYAEMRELVPELFKGITDGAERIKNIVAGLKDYARQDLSDPYATTNVNEAVQASLLLLGSMIKKSTRKFSVDYGAAIPPVKGAKQKIEQVVINLVQNSCQALKSLDAAIRIKTSFEDGRVKVCVSDEGCGIAKESMPFIRDPFYTTKRDSGGTGLGLSISAGIVDELGGDMVFESTPGVGTIATISLPPASGVSSKPLPS